LEEPDDSKHDEAGEHGSSEQVAVELARVAKNVADREGRRGREGDLSHAPEIDWLRRCLDPPF
jgi:hypothetical protein